jgi:hypothetical protein
MDLGPKGCDDQYGCGLVDARRAALSLAPNAAAPSTTAPNMARSKPTLLFSDRWPDARTLSPPLIDRRQQSAAANPFAEKTSLTSAGLD